MGDQLLSALLQVVAFSLIPLLVYVVRKRRFKGFFEYIGLKRSTQKANLLALLVVLLVGLPVLLLSYFNAEFHEIMISPTSMIGKFKAMGFSFSTMLMIVIAAGIKTSLSEEILFRGFLAKRLIVLAGFQIGNSMQAIVFGVIHSLLFMTITNNPFFLAFIFFFPALGAYCKVYLNEKLANGSIIPGWIAHGCANIIAYSGAFFF